MRFLQSGAIRWAYRPPGAEWVDSEGLLLTDQLGDVVESEEEVFEQESSGEVSSIEEDEEEEEEGDEETVQAVGAFAALQMESEASEDDSDEG